MKRAVHFSKLDQQFIKTVWDFYKDNGRHDLPWRKTVNPYRILVSELMLQQTQVIRVIPKYRTFLKLFPTVQALSKAPLGDVLKAWQGLGYNRRAKFLWQTAGIIVNDHNGKWPKTLTQLQALPGIGSYTAGALMNFCYDIPVPLVETNVRTVYIHHYFKNKPLVSDVDLLPIIASTLDKSNPKEWNWALMDYGSHLKSTIGNASAQSKSYKKQSPFKGSNRYIRGAVLKLLMAKKYSRNSLNQELSSFDISRIETQLEALTKEGLVVKKGQFYSVPH
jgi:A/G-specific adenine glycosylase